MPGRRLARAAALVAGLADELPAVGAVAMEGDEEIVGGGRVELGGKKFDDVLGRAVAVSREREIDRLGGQCERLVQGGKQKHDRRREDHP